LKGTLINKFNLKEFKELKGTLINKKN